NCFHKAAQQLISPVAHLFPFFIFGPPRDSGLDDRSTHRVVPDNLHEVSIINLSQIEFPSKRSALLNLAWLEQIVVVESTLVLGVAGVLRDKATWLAFATIPTRSFVVLVLIVIQFMVPLFLHFLGIEDELRVSGYVQISCIVAAQEPTGKLPEEQFADDVRCI